MGAAVLGSTVRRQPMPSWGICIPAGRRAQQGGGKKILVVVPQILFTELVHMADEMICLKAHRKSNVRQDLFGNPVS